MERTQEVGDMSKDEFRQWLQEAKVEMALASPYIRRYLELMEKYGEVIGERQGYLADVAAKRTSLGLYKNSQ